MIKVTLRDNTTKKMFTKEFDSQYLADNFIRKVRYGKRLTVLTIIKED